jgi:hypothetical protein
MAHDKISLKKIVVFVYSAKKLDLSNVHFQSKKRYFSKHYWGSPFDASQDTMLMKIKQNST